MSFWNFFIVALGKVLFQSCLVLGEAFLIPHKMGKKILDLHRICSSGSRKKFPNENLFWLFNEASVLYH